MNRFSLNSTVDELEKYTGAYLRPWEMSNQPQGSRILLLTGLPGVGKTTLIRKVIEALPDEKIRGFTTEEIRVHGNRTGFRLDTFDGDSAILAHTDIRSPHTVGRYKVDVGAMDQVVDVALRPDRSVRLYLIDEIGKMECFSTKFVAAVKTLLDSDTKMVATIPLKGSGFIRRVKERADVELWEITRENRNAMLHQILAWVRQE